MTELSRTHRVNFHPHGQVKGFMILQGPAGAVTLSWGFKFLANELDGGYGFWQWRAVCFHSPVPLPDMDSELQKCDWLEGGCYGDCGLIIADEWGKLLQEGKSDEVWLKLEEWYFERLHPNVEQAAT